MTHKISPIAATDATTPEWMRNIQEYDALEIHPCQIIGRDAAGNEYAEICNNPADADFWTVYGHLKTGALMTSRTFPRRRKQTFFTTG
jgi:hypothetical protein